MKTTIFFFSFLILTLLLVTTTHASLIQDYEDQDRYYMSGADVHINVQGQEGEKVGKPETGASGDVGVGKPETGSSNSGGDAAGVGTSDAAAGNNGGGPGRAAEAAGSNCITEEVCSVKKVICFKKCFRLPTPEKKDQLVEKNHFIIPKCKFVCKKCVPTC